MWKVLSVLQKNLVWSIPISMVLGLLFGNLLDHRNVRLLKGSGYIKEPKRMAVRQVNGTTLEVPYDRLILATGSEPLHG